MRRDAAWWGAVIVSMLTAGFLPAAAGASELIGRNATAVRLQADASGRAAVTFRSRAGTRRQRQAVPGDRDGPGVAPDVMWQGPAPAPYDSSADAQANEAQRGLLVGRPPLRRQLSVDTTPAPSARP